MTEKPKRPSEDHLGSVAQQLTAPGTPAPSNWELAFEDVWEDLPHVGAVLALLMRGLNSDDEPVRYRAFNGLLRAFPSAETPLSELAKGIQSDDTKVRLAAIERVIIILANHLPFLSDDRSPNRLRGAWQAGIQSTATGKEPGHFKEDRVEHAGRWVAWSRDRQRVIAVADSFADVVAQARRRANLTLT